MPIVDRPEVPLAAIPVEFQSRRPDCEFRSGATVALALPGCTALLIEAVVAVLGKLAMR